MIGYRMLIFSLAIYAISISFADAGTRGDPLIPDAQWQAAYRVMEATGGEAQMRKMIDQMIEVQIQQDPMMQPYRHVLQEFFGTYMSYETLRDQYVEIYVDYFSADELNRLADFYETALGTKLISLGSDIVSEQMQIAIYEVSRHSHKLQDMLVVEMRRLERLKQEEDARYGSGSLFAGEVFESTNSEPGNTGLLDIEPMDAGAPEVNLELEAPF